MEHGAFAEKGGLDAHFQVIKVENFKQAKAGKGNKFTFQTAGKRGFSPAERRAL